MKNSCRIGRVKMKSGGADIHIIEGKAQTRYDNIFNNAKSYCSDAVGAEYFIKHKDGATSYGWTAEPEQFISEIYGAAAFMLNEISSDIREK